MSANLYDKIQNSLLLKNGKIPNVTPDAQNKKVPQQKIAYKHQQPLGLQAIYKCCLGMKKHTVW